MKTSKASDKPDDNRVVDLDQVLVGTDGQPITEIEYEDAVDDTGKIIGRRKAGVSEVTLAMLAHAALRKPPKDERAANDMKRTLQLAKLANRVIQGGQQALSKKDATTIIDKLAGFPMDYVFGAVSILDPDRLEDA